MYFGTMFLPKIKGLESIFDHFFWLLDVFKHIDISLHSRSIPLPISYFNLNDLFNLVSVAEKNRDLIIIFERPLTIFP